MSTTLQLRRGTTAQHSTFTGAVGEITVDTDKDTAVVHDGSTAGGFPLAKATDNTTLDTTSIEVTNLKAKDGTSAGSIANTTGVVTLASSVLTTADINGGTIDGTTIGGTTAAAGSFTTLSSTAFTSNPATLTANVSLAAGYNAVSAGPLTIGDGVTVTLADTSNWSII